MSTADGSEWSGLTDAYGRTFDLRDLLKKVAPGNQEQSCWETIWDRLHHQGDVGTASYAAVPPLVDHYTARDRPWQIYAYVATLEECRRDPGQPRMPGWIEGSYATALERLAALATDDLRGPRGAGFLISLFAFLAVEAGCVGLSVALLNLGDNELAMEDLTKFGDSLHDL